MIKKEKSFFAKIQLRMEEIRNNFFKKFSNIIGIDLGTVNTVAVEYSETMKPYYNQSSFVAVNKNTNTIELFGNDAQAIIGRVPDSIEIVRPVEEGVVAHFEVVENLIAFLIRELDKTSVRVFGPTIVVSVPPSATDVDIYTFKQSAKKAGAREVYVVYEPVAALMGIMRTLSSKKASMIIDIGGGTTDVLVFLNNKVIQQKSIPIGGCYIDRMLSDGLRKNDNIEVGERSIENFKKEVLSQTSEKNKKYKIRGRHTVSNLPIEIEMRQDYLETYIYETRREIVSFVKNIMSSLNPEIVSDFINEGVYLTGGGCHLLGVKKSLEEELQAPVTICERPFEVVAQGAAIMGENTIAYREFFI